jgi:hypothetical protein
MGTGICAERIRASAAMMIPGNSPAQSGVGRIVDM